jgi:hypothetical protein
LTDAVAKLYCMEISGVILPAFQPNAIEDVISFL